MLCYSEKKSNHQLCLGVLPGEFNSYVKSTLEKTRLLTKSRLRHVMLLLDKSNS